MTERAVPELKKAVSLLKEYFFSRTDIAAFFGPWGNPHPTIPPTDLDALLAAHVAGENAPKAGVHHTSKRKGGHKVIKGWFRIGSYVPAPDNTTPWLCIDFDGGDDHADALADPTAAVLRSYRLFVEHGLPAYIERSGGGKGWHLWLFFEPGIQAAKARRLAQQLLPTDLPLANGGTADHRSNKGVEIFPKQDRLSKKGTGNLVWLPWWSDAKGDGNQFFQATDDDALVPFVPESFNRVDEALLDQVLAATKREDPHPAKRSAKPKQSASIDGQQNWQIWRREALAALRLEDVYGNLLTGDYSGEGWLECRDPSSNSGDQNPSAGVSDGTNSAERGSFHSFISGETISVFDFMIQQGIATDLKGAIKRVAELTRVQLPHRSSSSSTSHSLPDIQINQRQLRDIIDDAWEAISLLNEQKGPEGRPHPFLFRRGRSLVRMTQGKDDQPIIEPMEETAVYGILLRTANWMRETQEGAVNAAPPRSISQDMVEFPDKKLPILDSILTSPVYDSTGKLIIEPGYHPEEQLWYQPDPDLVGLHIPDYPTPNEIAEARSLLLDDLVVDFPFEKQSDQAHIVAAMLLPFVRRMIPGCTPIHLVEAPTQGSGKGLLCSLVSIVTTGQPLASRTLPTVEEEVRKMFTSELSLGRPIILLDNADDTRRLHSPSLASVTTSTVWTDRLLGKTAMLTMPNRAMWMLTGNNPKLSLELARRCIRIRINPQVDHAWKRQEFKHDEVVEWATENRVRLTRAVLILIQAWIAHGKPQTKFRLGSFERWSKIIGGILEVAGIPGFLETLDELYENSNEEENAWRAFIEAWWDAYQQTPVRVSDLNELCEREELLIALRGDKSARSQQTRLGKALGRYRDRVFNQVRLVRMNVHGKHAGGLRVALVPVSSSTGTTYAGQAEKMETLGEKWKRSGNVDEKRFHGSNPVLTLLSDDDGNVGNVVPTPRAREIGESEPHKDSHTYRGNGSGSNVSNVSTNGGKPHQQRASGMETLDTNVSKTFPHVSTEEEFDLSDLPEDFNLPDDSDLPF